MIRFIFFVILSFLSVSESANCKEGYRGYKQEFRYVKIDGASIFYWFFESFKAGEDPYQLSSIPLIIVPGSPERSASSIAVLESGPFNEYGLPRKNTSLCRDYHVLYIDAVPGTGFSEVDAGCKQCYRTNSSQVATDLIKVVLEFYKRKPHLQSVPSFIYAQSYGAQIAVKFSLLLDEAIEEGKCNSDFRGVFLISPWISPYHLIESWPEYFNVMGYIDENNKNTLNSIVKNIKNSINKSNATYRSSQAMKLLNLVETEIKNSYNNINFCNLLKDQCQNTIANSTPSILLRTNSIRKKHMSNFHPLVKCAENRDLKEFMNSHVKPELSCVVSSDISFDRKKEIALQNMGNDLFESVTPEVQTLLERGLMLVVITSQFDATCNSIGTANWIKSLNWKGNQSWYTAPYKPFRFSSNDYCDISVFKKSYDNLHYVTLLKAGHLPYKQFPEIMLSIMDNAIKHKIY
ncbi:uncharacterized protein LOC142333827 [Lycorma delicatula]|uniref:uncharacterized protein LOC142333827 n=1 Tax=Lycorma delicatula TaxID=130591 RepID=UPI003F513356